MNTHVSLCLSALLIMALAGFVAGCRRVVDEVDRAREGEANALQDGAHDIEDVSLTQEEVEDLRRQASDYASAVQLIQSFRDTIRDETTAGVPAKAHVPLDKVDYLLQWLPEIAQQSNIPQQYWQTIGENSQLLRELFDRVHVNIDSGSPPDYESGAAVIDQRLAELAAVVSDDPRGSN